jgi:hypothetical protein
MLDTLLGGIIAIIAGWAATWLQSLNIRKNRINEIIAERKVTANAQAYSYIKEIEASFTQCSNEETHQRISTYEEWFFNNRLFLSETFSQKWLSIRNNLRKLVRWQKEKSKTPSELTTLEIQIQNLINDAIDEIYKDMNLRRSRLKKSQKSSGLKSKAKE